MLIALPNAFGDAATNMAIDTALLESLPTGLAVFRHYGWTEPAATFGYAQAYASVVSELASCSHATLVRRLTGGGIVDHRNDWTYALILHAVLPAASIPATALYEHLHRAIAQTLGGLGLETRLAPCPKLCDNPHPPRALDARKVKTGASRIPDPASRIPYPASRIPDPASHIPDPASRIPDPASRIPDPASQCFVTPAANDVIRVDGRKIAGAAMKRNRDGLLIQGSLDRGALPENFDFITFQAQLIEALATALELPIGTLEDFRPLFQGGRIEKQKQRFASDEWNWRR
jgi:lipoate-protein ligase A